MSKRRKLQQTPDLAIYSNDGVVDNLLSTDASKALSANQGSVIQATLDLKAPFASPTLTGVPAAPTATSGTNTTQIATTAFVQTAVAGIVDTAPETLDTLNELAAALGDDPNFATTVSTQIGTKLDTSTWNNSAASGITSTQVTNWDTAYGWGDHGSAGYAPANTTVTTNTIQTISGAKSLTSDLTLGSGGSYEDLILKTDTIVSGYNGTFSITPRTVPGSGAAGQLTYFKNNISGAGTTRHDVSIDGYVGIGTTPSEKLDVAGNILASGNILATAFHARSRSAPYTSVSETGSGAMSIFGHNALTSYDYNNRVVAPVSSWFSSFVRMYYNEGIAFHTTSSPVSAGDILYDWGNPELQVAGSAERARFTNDGYLRFSAASGGIQFNGDTSASNALDDYEEGTLTMTPLGITSGATGISHLSALYTKVGKLVHIQGEFGISNASAGVLAFSFRSPISMNQNLNVGQLGVCSAYPYSTNKASGYAINNTGSNATDFYMELSITSASTSVVSYSLTYRTD